MHFMSEPYLIFVISFTQAAFSNSKFYTRKFTKNTQKWSGMNSSKGSGLPSWFKCSVIAWSNLLFEWEVIFFLKFAKQRAQRVSCWSSLAFCCSIQYPTHAMSLPYFIPPLEKERHPPNRTAQYIIDPLVLWIMLKRAEGAVKVAFDDLAVRALWH